MNRSIHLITKPSILSRPPLVNGTHLLARPHMITRPHLATRPQVVSRFFMVLRASMYTKLLILTRLPLYTWPNLPSKTLLVTGSICTEQQKLGKSFRARLRVWKEQGGARRWVPGSSQGKQRGLGAAGMEA